MKRHMATTALLALGFFLGMMPAGLMQQAPQVVKADLWFGVGTGWGWGGWGGYPYGGGSGFGLGVGDWDYDGGGGAYYGVGVSGPARSVRPVSHPVSGYYNDGYNVWATQDLYRDGGFTQVAPVQPGY